MCHSLCMEKENETGDQPLTWKRMKDGITLKILGAIPLKHWLLEDTATEYPQTHTFMA